MPVVGPVERAFIGMGTIETVGREQLTIGGFLVGFGIGSIFGYVRTKDAGLALSSGGLLGGVVGVGTFLYATGGKLITERLKR